MTLTFGYKASAEQFAPKPLLDFAVEAEAAGFDSAFISDHFQPWRHTGGHAPFSLAWMGALGQATQRLVIGTSVLTPTFRYHPSLIAHAFGSLGAMFPRRVILGIGTGESLNETPATGLVWPEQRERTLRFKEAVRLIRTLWSEDRVSFEGDYYHTENATIYDRPETPVPVYIAAAGPMMAKFAGQEGDGFICTSGKKPELYTETLLPKVAEGEAATGKSTGDVDRMIEIKLSYDPDRQRALEDCRFWGALALSPDEKMNVEDPLAMEKLADNLPIERAASRFIVTNDPEEAVDRIGSYVALGFRHLVFHGPGPDQSRYISLLGKDILPRLQKRFG